LYKQKIKSKDKMDSQKLLEDFLKHISEVYTDQYGHLQIVEEGDDLDPTYERVSKEFLEEWTKINCSF
jgi:uncharacterized protein YnzC (UPF0291/DUF896 family)